MVLDRIYYRVVPAYDSLCYLLVQSVADVLLIYQRSQLNPIILLPLPSLPLVPHILVVEVLLVD